MAKIKATGIILAGGQSSRMRKNKAFLPVGNLPIIERVLKELQEVCQELIIITNTPEEYQHLGVPVAVDLIPRKGPLSGVHAGLVFSKYYYNLVVACDMPFIHPKLATFLLTQTPGFDAVIPRIQGQPQPLFAVYSKACIKPIERRLHSEKRRTTDLYQEIKVLWVEEEVIRLIVDPEIVFCNVNTPQEWDRVNTRIKNE
ncbi:MAG: molybdenum cofactor guanylyltransferase [Syntrophomonadaceae bacterium]|nr:molybdenum cofactor guanylyltransferase [Syntrophomonadaceae bacterium]